MNRSSENDAGSSATRKSRLLTSKSLFLTSKSEMLASKSLFLTSKSKMLARKSLFLIADVEPRKCFYRPRSNARPASGLIDPTGKIVVSVIGDEVSGVLCTCRFRVWAQAHRQHGPTELRQKWERRIWPGWRSLICSDSRSSWPRRSETGP